MANEENEAEVPAPDVRPDYTAFEMWKYRPIISRTREHHSWRSMPDSYFYACEPLVVDLAGGKLREDIEGTAAIFLFRHFLELALKRLVFMGRVVTAENENLLYAAKREIVEVAKIHGLNQLWAWVLSDAKPSLEHWDNYDTAMVEKCVREFGAIDPNGLAFRYAGEGGEFCRYNFGALRDQMNHVRQVLDGLFYCLEEMRRDIQEYDQYLTQEFGGGDEN